KDPLLDLPPLDYMRTIQLNEVALNNVAGAERISKMRKGTLELYARLQPRDAQDAMLAGVMVGIYNFTMESIADCEGSVTNTQGELNRRYALKGARTLADLSELYDRRR